MWVLPSPKLTNAEWMVGRAGAKVLRRRGQATIS